MVYVKYERFLSSHDLESFANVKIKLRMSFALFFTLVLSRTVYFAVEKSQVYIGENDERVMYFAEQLYVYLSEIMFSAIIVTILMRMYLKTKACRESRRAGGSFSSTIDGTVLDDNASEISLDRNKAQ